MSKSHRPPDINKALPTRPTRQEIADSYDRAWHAQGGAKPDRLKPEEPPRGKR